MFEDLRSDYIVEVSKNTHAQQSPDGLNFKQAAAYAAKAAPDALRNHDAIHVLCAGVEAVDMSPSGKVTLVDLDTSFRENERNYIAHAIMNALGGPDNPHQAIRY